MQPPPAPRFAPRTGFTVLESIVAMVLVNVGILALMSATTVAARAGLASHQRAAARRTAMNRIEWLSAQPCATAPTSGDTTADVAPGSIERWRVTIPMSGIREITDSVGYPLRDSVHWVFVTARVFC
jgi:Tfp pilus assembly protein PilV